MTTTQTTIAPHVETLSVLPDGRIMLGTRELTRRESDDIRPLITDADGALPQHIGALDLPNGGKRIWRIEDGEKAGATWMPLPGQAFDAEMSRVQLLLDTEIETAPDDPRPEEARLRQRHIPVWAIIGSLTPDGNNAGAVADAYDISPDAVLAARWFYYRNRSRIDARLLANEAE